MKKTILILLILILVPQLWSFQLDIPSEVLISWEKMASKTIYIEIPHNSRDEITSIFSPCPCVEVTLQKYDKPSQYLLNINLTDNQIQTPPVIFITVSDNISSKVYPIKILAEQKFPDTIFYYKSLPEKIVSCLRINKINLRDITDKINYEVFWRFQNQNKQTFLDLPVLSLQNRIFSGSREVNLKLQHLQTTTPEILLVENSSDRMSFFLPPGCNQCLSKLKEIEQFCKEKNILLEVIYLDSLTSYKKYLKYSGNPPKQSTLLVFKEKSYLSLESFKQMNALNISQKKMDTSILLCITTGLIDGINPCAFTTILFLFSFASLMKFNKMHLLKLGVFFSAGIFTAYFSGGLFIVLMGKSLWLTRYKTEINRITSVLTGIGGLYILYFNSGKFPGLSSKSISKIHSLIRKNITSRSGMFLIFFTGVFIALLEGVCTGQVYIPVLVYLSGFSRTQLITFLLIYNLAFIMPLLLVTFSLISGLQSDWIIKKARQNYHVFEILTGCLLILLSLILWFL